MLAIASVGCESPPAPPLPADGRLPPIEAAADCPPVTRFAQDYFYIADLATRRSCTLFIEQDECVLGIFDDCSHRSTTVGPRRQWTGRIDHQRTISIEPHYKEDENRKPPDRCTGPLMDPESPTRFAALACIGAADPHPGLFIERRIPTDDVTPFGTIDMDARVELERRATPWDDHLGDVALIEVAGRSELWVLLAMPQEPRRQGILIHDLDTDVQAALPVGQRTVMATLPGGGQLVAAGMHDIELWDTAARQVVTATTTEVDVDAVAVSLDGQTLYVAGRSPLSPIESVVQRYRVGDLSPLGDPVTLPDVILRLETTSSTGGAALLMAGYPGADSTTGVLYATTSTLTTMKRSESPWIISAFAPITGTPLVALVSRSSNAYREFDTETLQVATTVPNPLFSWTNAVAYDAAADRVLIAAHDGVTYMNRSDQRISQALVDIEETLTDLVWSPTLGKLFAVQGSVGVVDVITPTVAD